MKRILSAILTIVLVVSLLASFTSCADKKSDWEKISERGFFYVGITVYEPMNYFENDSLVGFDTEFAQLVAEELGVEVKFQIINWSSKYLELNSGAIDAIWNGFTANVADSDDGVQRSDKVDFSVAYMDNAQCVVVRSDISSTITSVSDLNGKKGAVESGSAGASYAATVTSADKIIQKDSQMETFTELKSGAADFIVVDILLANEVCGKGDFVDLVKVESIEIDKEVYAIGFRKGSDFTKKVDDVIEKFAKNGKLQEIADKYGLHLTEDLVKLRESN